MVALPGGHAGGVTSRGIHIRMQLSAYLYILWRRHLWRIPRAASASTSLHWCCNVVLCGGDVALVSSPPCERIEKGRQVKVAAKVLFCSGATRDRRTRQFSSCRAVFRIFVVWVFEPQSFRASELPGIKVSVRDSRTKSSYIHRRELKK